MGYISSIILIPLWLFLSAFYCIALAIAMLIDKESRRD